MNQLCKRILHVLILATVIGWTKVAWAQQQALANEKSAGNIADIQPRESGKLTVIWKSGKPPIDATVGMRVRRGYLFTLAEGASATIACADGSYPRLLPGQIQPCPCRSVARGNPRADRLIRGNIDTASTSFPVIVSPRSTKILSVRPTLRWSAPGTAFNASQGQDETAYVVGVHAKGQAVWTKENVKGNELAYPPDAPDLVPGLYLLVVTTSTGSSDEEGTPDRGFIVLPKCPARGKRNRRAICQAEVIIKEVNRIKRLNLSADSTRLLIADLSVKNGLYAEAIEAIEDVKKTLEVPAVVGRLGEIYARLGLIREAEKYYLEALSLPQIATDPQTKAAALSSLAQTYESLGDRSQATTRYDQAIEAYQELKDRTAIIELRRRRAIVSGRQN
jgi:hypothetical protein